MQFIDDWKRQFPRLWSVRLSLLAALVSSVEAGFTYWATGKAPVLVVAAAVISLGASVARIVAQVKVSDNG
ncbi:ABC-type multidrug transport system permease subunit [Microvirga lupini]|uniref:ABC-type multidrug transport system permease subunit n=1 Tax=Microvirga lupini TaxID=420324 RepID=A0A7W4VI97_9HYPH|nr:hypothetical protein [Microvirga lupini]MBB3017729.1 ABC-type multidrug transport system permease subunit [Microvirga lupini]